MDNSNYLTKYTSGNGSAHGYVGYNLVSVAGVGAAVYFQHFRPFSLNNWRSIRRCEFDELQGSSMLAANIAWDNTLSWTWRKAMDALQATLVQATFVIMKLMKEVPKTSVRGNILHIPNNKHWDAAVNKALQMIQSKSPLTKVSE